MSRACRILDGHTKRQEPSTGTNLAEIRVSDSCKVIRSGSYIPNLETLIDDEEWMRVFALERIVRNWDSFGIAEGHNMYAYKPTSSRWQLLLTDFDYAFEHSGATATNDFFETCENEAKENELMSQPAFRRAIWRTIQDAVAGPMLSQNIGPVFDATYAALTSNGFRVTTNATAAKTWVEGRRAYLTNLLTTVAVSFAITNHGGNNFTNASSTLTLAGTAPVAAAFIRFAGGSSNAPVSWDTVTNWSIPITLVSGANTNSIQAYDRKTNAISGLAASIIITR